jgi:hypothetical protein
MGSKPELKNIELICGDVLLDNKGKVSIFFQKMINIWMIVAK